MMADKEELLLRKRMSELATICYQRDITTCTEFLTLNEQTIFHSLRRELPPVPYLVSGGHETAERKIVCFLSSYEAETAVLPISVIEAGPANSRFSAPLNHRDYLGALMNLGIERRLIGDILMKETGCFIFCMTRMAEYITEQLLKVGNTPVQCKIVPNADLKIEQNYEEFSGSIASPRLDNLIALAFKTSRSKVIPYIEGEKVFIDGRIVASPGTSLKGGEIISVRGLGKFSYQGITTQTKKGRCYVTIKKYS